MGAAVPATSSPILLLSESLHLAAPLGEIRAKAMALKESIL